MSPRTSREESAAGTGGTPASMVALDGLDLVEPGLQVVHRWRPDGDGPGAAASPTDAQVSVYGTVARKG
ncbi:conserved hypothetical protein [Frankia canadensis]|uniref:Uncharacterized protein n=1 Tax=Frankia canadensis TaxID=1836972 RepID=A0A2I2KUH3_9ACTN|nr:conserved hypothetical protein [Frankia canadensis]SOU56601.1 conserved hypothetical protein [Frankia canadensis]